MTMADNEIGELWRNILGDCNKLDECQNHGNEVRLIRKLVEERARVYSGYDRYKDEWIPDALRAFGITPEEWREKEGDL